MGFSMSEQGKREKCRLPKTNMEPKNEGLEGESPFKRSDFQDGKVAGKVLPLSQANLPYVKVKGLNNTLRISPKMMRIKEHEMLLLFFGKDVARFEVDVLQL